MSAQDPGPEIASKSAFGEPLGTWLRLQSSELQTDNRICTAPFLSGAKWHRSNTPKFAASHLGKTGHIGTNTLKFVTMYPIAWDDRRLTLLKRGCANSVVGLELADQEKRSK